jgi:diguanylate cyclase (GGDEF)-like protein/PAS domain S-box-containing protein
MRSDREAGDTAAPLLQALKAMPAWVTWERDGGGRLGFVSPECERVTGYPAAAFLAEPGLHLRIVRDDDRELFEAARAAAGEEGSTARYRIVTAHGFERWIESTWRAVPEARDPGPEVVAEHRDVTVSMARLQEAERDSEVLAASPAVAFHWQAAPGWPVTYVSTNVRRWGYAPDEFTTGSLLYAEVLHPDDLERVRREVEKNLGAGVDEYLQRYRVRFASGQYRWVDDATSVARDQHGAVLHLRGIVLDVDAQVRTTRALEESEARFRRLAEHAPDLIYRFEYWPERGFTFVSKAATAITGYSPEEHYSDPDLGFKLVHPDDRSLLEAAVRGDIPAGEPLRLRWVRKDGRIVWTEQRNVPVLDDAGRLVAIEGIARDVSAAARNEADLRRWADVFRHTRVGVVTSTRGEDTLDLVNPAFAEMHGTGVEALRGSPIEDLFPPEERSRLAQAIASAQARGHHAWRSRHLRPDGSTFPVLIDLVEVDGDRDPYRVATVHDISEWSEAEAALRASEALLRSAHVVAGLGSWRFDLASSTFQCSPEVLTLFGVAGEEPLRFEHFVPAFHPKDAPAVRRAWDDAVAGRSGYDLEYRVVVGGSVRWVQEVVATEHDQGGVPGALIGTVRDVTERREADAMARRLAFVVEQSPSVIVLTDTDGVIEYVNRRFEEVTGRTRATVVGRPTRELKSGRNDPSLYRELWQTITAGKVWQGEFSNVRADGEPYWERATIAPVTDARGTVTHYVKLAEDISAARALSDQVERLSFQDAVTGLANRSLFLDRVDKALAAVRHGGARVAVLLADIDDLRIVSEAWGHKTGDTALRQVGERLAARLDDDDTLAHLAGGQLGVLVPNAGDTNAIAVLARSLHRALDTPVDPNGESLHLSLVVGVAIAPEDGDTSDVLLRRATAALREAEAAGPGETRFYSRDLDRKAREHLRLESALRRAIEQDDIWVAYQPRVDLRSGDVVGMEALARWTDRREGEVPPGRFIPLAESTHLIRDIDRSVLTMVLRQLGRWLEAGKAVVPVSVNLSSSEFGRAGIVDDIAASIDAAALPPRLIEIELTESVALGDVDRTAATIAELRELGVTVAIDDFGAGYASFAQLKRLPVSTLKIDIGFIRDLGAVPSPSSRDASIVLAIISLGHILGLDVVAEGVETEAQRDFLAGHGCTYAQGYLLGRPAPPEYAEARLKRGGLRPRERHHVRRQQR